ncbi:MAG: T9SS C-terminal target domain-containing protein, partial [Calditrichaeota bacterium]
ALIAWIDDSQTTEKDGYLPGETMSFKVWVQSTDTEFSATPTYAQGNGTFGDGAFASVALAAVSGGRASGIVVTNTNDSGEGSLRAAIIQANSHAGPDTIVFHIPQSDPGFNSADGTWTIQPLQQLEGFDDDSLFLDGSSQADFIGSDTNPNGPEIVLNGEKAGEGATGISIFSSDNVIKEVVVNGFDGRGIWINGFFSEVKGNKIIGNYIGTNAAGTDSIPNPVGIQISNSWGNIVGGTEPSSRNVISGNRWWGIVVDEEKSSDNAIIGNYVGTDVTGTRALGNGNVGIYLMEGTHHSTIGGTQPGERNIISGNGAEGIRIEGHHNTVLGNYIGTDVSGKIGLGNSDGISLMFGADHNIVGGTQPGEGNLVSANRVRGIVVVSDSNQVAGNYIGTDAAKTEALGNKREGISVTYGASNNIIGPNNVITDNGLGGVSVFTDSSVQNTITENSIFHNVGPGIDNLDGGNAELGRPQITNFSGGIVTGTAPANSTVELFSDDDDEGRIYEGATTADANGQFQWNGTPTGPHVTATATDTAGNTSEFSQFYVITSVAETKDIIPDRFELKQNYPNPFNPETVIRYALPVEASVKLRIVNLRGQEIITLVDKKQRPGFYSVMWDGRDRRGVAVASGLYLYRVEAGEFVAVRKMMLLR